MGAHQIRHTSHISISTTNLFTGGRRSASFSEPSSNCTYSLSPTSKRVCWEVVKRTMHSLRRAEHRCRCQYWRTFSITSTLIWFDSRVRVCDGHENVDYWHTHKHDLNQPILLNIPARLNSIRRVINERQLSLLLVHWFRPDFFSRVIPAIHMNITSSNSNNNHRMTFLY